MNSTVHAFRLERGADLKSSILEAVSELNITAGCVLSVVGCLSKAEIRLADENESVVLEGPLEIIQLSGTLTPLHVHLHMSVSDRQGSVRGGHVLEGCTVSHTAEVCLMAFNGLTFSREFDESTGFTELTIRPGTTL